MVGWTNHGRVLVRGGRVIQFSNYAFHPVVFMPEVYDIRDFTTMDNANRMPTHPYSVGKYDEDRAGMYTHELFEGMRTVHMGIDIGTPAHIAVHAFWDGKIFACGYNEADGDYGHVLVTEHELNGVLLWALHGHLSAASILGKEAGQPIQRGQILGAIGDTHENGGWPPHSIFNCPMNNQRPTICRVSSPQPNVRMP